MQPVYIGGVGSFLPNEPVPNDRIEAVLGQIGDTPSRTRARVLKNNGIISRHYAIDPATGRLTHTAAQLATEAIRAALRDGETTLEEIDCLACGTTAPDALVPSHALSVHGELGAPPAEVVSLAGVCASGMAALKYVSMAIRCGFARRGIATGAEHSSSVLRAAHFDRAPRATEEDLDRDPALAFGQEFLRWMLSDGAGAILLRPDPRPRGLSLRLEWIEIISLAGSMETCMYWGAEKREDGSLVGWREAGSPADAARAGMLYLSQDVKLLGREIHRMISDALPSLRRRHGLNPGDVTWLLPHYSSEYFRQPLHDKLRSLDFPIPFEKWFTNLPTRGNTGAASIFIMLDDLLKSGRVSAGDRILCFVPESARFTAAYALMTAVAPPS